MTSQDRNPAPDSRNPGAQGGGIASDGRTLSPQSEKSAPGDRVLSQQFETIAARDQATTSPSGKSTPDVRALSPQGDLIAPGSRALSPQSEKSAPDAAFSRSDGPSPEKQRRCTETGTFVSPDFHQSESSCAGVSSSGGDFPDRDPSGRAAEWFDRARSGLCAAHPYLGFALARLEPAAGGKFTLPATDGARLWLNPARLPEGPAALFHSLLHCLLGHLFDPQLSELACDLAAMLYAADHAPALCPALDDPLFRDAKRRCGGARDAAALMAVIDRDGFFSENRDALRALLALDDHGLWSSARREDARLSSAGGEGLSDRWRRAARGLGGGRQGAGSSASSGSERMTLGEGAHHDYARHLRRYAVSRENPRDDPDSLQPGWYAYGLSHYGNVPLIEPMEFREERKLEALAIAIDTSGSCARGLTKQFLEQTRDILLRERLFFGRFRLHILQCDAKVQRDDRIENLRQFQRYIDDLTVAGGGGTDFRPAIERVQALVRSGELRGLKGMLYFSDGRGIFPARPPEFEVTFVFLKYRYDPIDVPAWVRTLVLDAPRPRGGEYIEY